MSYSTTVPSQLRLVREMKSGGLRSGELAEERGEAAWYLPETKTPAQGRGGCFVVFARSRKLSLIGTQCQPVDRCYEWLTPVSTPIYTGASPRRKPSMPHSVQYRPLLIDELISSHRIASYSKVFSTTNDAELVGAYLWNSHVCAALYPLLSAVEVTLRNSIDAALMADLGKFWWKAGKLKYKSFTPGAVTRPYPIDRLTKNFSTAFNVAKTERKERGGKGSPDHQEVVSKTDFSTWEFILENEYMGNNLIWPKHLGRVFKGQWPTTQAATMLADCKNRVCLVRKFRNRVFHHEPAWKRFGVTDEQQAVVHLHEKIGKITELISWISPEKIDLLEKSGVIRTAYRACSVAEIERFKYQSKTSTVNSMAKLIKVAEAASLGNKVVKIAVYGRRKAVYTMQPA